MPVTPRQFARRVWRRLRRTLAPPPIVLGRIACLGYDVLHVSPYEEKITLLNQQKTRCDLLLRWLDASANRPVARVIEPFMLRQDVFPLIVQQEKLPWLECDRPVRFLLMDSFAELTDQEFVHRREGWSFACHYSDVSHPPEFEELFECRGLMPVETFAPAYAAFFDWFSDRFPGAPIYFLQFPTRLDNRQVFKDRAAAIGSAIVDLAKTRPHLKNIEVPETDVHPDVGNTFPYHFAASTYRAFAKAWSAVDEQPAG